VNFIRPDIFAKRRKSLKSMVWNVASMEKKHPIIVMAIPAMSMESLMLTIIAAAMFL